MVSWDADGTLAGYDGVTAHLQPNAYKFASAGSVAVDAITRLHYALPAYSTTTYPNRLSMTARLTFSPADFAAHPGGLSAAAYIAPASLFPPGSVPTPLGILQLGSQLQEFWANWYVTGPGPQTHTFEIPGPDPGTLQPNTRYWVLIVPTAYASGVMVPMGGVDPNVIGRAISFWTNRIPKAPVITSPSPGSTVPPGDSFQFSYDTQDPDTALPDDSGRMNRDLAGIHVQYAAMPTPSKPNPPWRDLPFYTLQNEETIAGFIRGQAGWIQVDGRDRMLDNLGFPILCGANIPGPGKGALPSGQWQLRCRTFDFGHPYPAWVNPLGLSAGNYTVNSYATANTSPWSAPVQVSIPAQVAPPILLSPTDNLAVIEGSTVRLNWQYRNTFRPPFAQASRTVQIRKVGDPEWSTVFNGPSDLPYVDLPPSIEGSGAGAHEYLTDTGFEAGTLGGWSAYPGTAAVANDNDPAEAHSGSRSLEVISPLLGVDPSATRVVNLDPAHDLFRLRGWLRPSRMADVALDSIAWFAGPDGTGEELYPNPFRAGWSMYRPGSAGAGLWPEWVYGDAGETTLVPGAQSVKLTYLFYSFVDEIVNGSRLDDLSFVGSSSTDTDPFTMVATTLYEWRVQTQDTDGEVSNYSQPARFWVVPVPGSGEVIPLPSGTIEGATLGCGKHTVKVYRRGGLTPVGTLDGLDSLEWNRLRDDISSAKAVVKDWGPDCGELLKGIRPWQHEIVIFRDNGFSNDRVWEGPITAVTYERDSVTVVAGDVMRYAYRRIIKQTMNDSKTGDTVTGRAARVLMNVFAPDDPNVLSYMTVLGRDDDTRQRRNIPGWSRTAFEEVDDMASNVGLDYTCAGRAILLWGTKNRIGTLPELRDKDLGSPPIVSVYGMSMGNVYAVSDGNGVYGVAVGEGSGLTTDGGSVSGNDPANGLVEILSSSWASDGTPEEGTYTQAGVDSVRESFVDSAERSIADRFPVPIVVRIPDNTTLNPSAVLSIQQLVPGVVVPLRSTGTLLSVVQNQKLDSVKVIQNSKGEKISITLSPFANEDGTVEEGGEE
jgi:hypothetical protein